LRRPLVKSGYTAKHCRPPRNVKPSLGHAGALLGRDLMVQHDDTPIFRIFDEAILATVPPPPATP
jgi:hypothetical protein